MRFGEDVDAPGVLVGVVSELLESAEDMVEDVGRVSARALQRTEPSRIPGRLDARTHGGAPGPTSAASALRNFCTVHTKLVC